jgi:hypothetical protein
MSVLRSSLVRSPFPALRVLSVTASLAMLTLVILAVPAAGSVDGVQDLDEDELVGNGSATGQDEFDGRSTEDTVRLVVGTLVGIAGVTSVMMLVFVWHTSPRRRLRVATRRAERHRVRVEREDPGDGVTLDELLGNRDAVAPEAWGDAECDGVELGELVEQASGSHGEIGDREDAHDDEDVEAEGEGGDNGSELDRAEDVEVGETRE